MGQHVFLAVFFTPFVIGTLIAITGYGLTRSPLIALAATVNVLLLFAAGHYLYAGKRNAERIVWGVGVVFLVLALVAFAMERNLATKHLAIQLLMPAIFAAALGIPSVRVFLAFQRGDYVPPVELPSESATQTVPFESILTPGPEGNGVALREDAKLSALSYARGLRLVAGLLILCTVGGIAIAVLSLVSKGSGVMMFIAALVAVPPALLLLNLADDWYYLATTKGYEKAHLTNIVDNTETLSTWATGSLVVLALLAMLELAMR